MTNEKIIAFFSSALLVVVMSISSFADSSNNQRLSCIPPLYAVSILIPNEMEYYAQQHIVDYIDINDSSCLFGEPIYLFNAKN